MAELDGELLQDVGCARDGLKALEGAGFRSEFWEQFCVLQGARDAFRAEVRRLKDLLAEHKVATLDRGILEMLTGVRRRLGPLVEDLRKFCGTIPDAPDGEQLEITLGFMMISPRALEMVPRWLFDPRRWAGEAAEKMRAIAGVVDRYRSALMETETEAPPPVESAPPSPPPPPAEVRPAPVQEMRTPVPAPPRASETTVRHANGPDPEVVEELHLIEECRAVATEVETWELMCLIESDRDEATKIASEIVRLKKEDHPEDLAKAIRTLEGKIETVRSQHGHCAEDLRTYVATLQVGHFGKDTMDIALGFILASPRGRQRAQEWLGDPQRHRGVAADRLEDLIRRAMMYQSALRSTVA